MSPALQAGQSAPHPRIVEPYSVLVRGETAHGFVAYPADVLPTTLLVIAHGCCGPLDQFGFLNVYENRFVIDHGVAVVAMSYRGNGHWTVWSGHEDTIAATEDLQQRWPIERTVVWGISMGGEVSGMAVAARPDLFDYWVDSMGVTDLYEEFAAFGLMPYPPQFWAFTPPPVDPTSTANPIGSWILEETGGLPGSTSDPAWDIRSPAKRTSEMVGLTRAYLNYNSGDMVVPAGQGIRTFDGLADAGVPVTLCIGATRFGPLQGPYFNEAPAIIAPAAHEWGPMACTFDQLHALLSGAEPDQGDPVVVRVRDETTGAQQTLPLV